MKLMFKTWKDRHFIILPFKLPFLVQTQVNGHLQYHVQNVKNNLTLLLSFSIIILNKKYLQIVYAQQKTIYFIHVPNISNHFLTFSTSQVSPSSIPYCVFAEQAVIVHVLVSILAIFNCSNIYIRLNNYLCWIKGLNEILLICKNQQRNIG